MDILQEEEGGKTAIVILGTDAEAGEEEKKKIKQCSISHSGPVETQSLSAIGQVYLREKGQKFWGVGVIGQLLTQLQVCSGILTLHLDTAQKKKTVHRLVCGCGQHSLVWKCSLGNHDPVQPGHFTYAKLLRGFGSFLQNSWSLASPPFRTTLAQLYHCELEGACLHP